MYIYIYTYREIAQSLDTRYPVVRQTCGTTAVLFFVDGGQRPHPHAGFVWVTNLSSPGE